MNQDTKLLRQVHPSFVQGNTISFQVFSSQVFKPTPKDENKLSVYNGELYTPIEAFSHYSDSGYKSIGIVAVTIEECNDEELNVYEDNIPFEGHCSIDYTGFSNCMISKKAQKLKYYASKRGWLHIDTNN
jgi:hypothetical protein